MGLNNKTNLKSQASTIRHEDQEGLNTAERVGKVLEELIESADASLTTETNARTQADNNLTQQLTIVSNTATTAYNEAKDAKSKAVAAHNSANAAQSTADTAKSTAEAAQASADAAQETADAAKTAAQGAHGALNTLNDRVIAMGNTVSGHTTAISNLTEIVDEQYTAIQGCYELIMRNDTNIHSIGIVPFDGLYDADNVPATGVWFRRYGADEGGMCAMWSADGKFPAGFLEHDYNVTEHGFEHIRTDRVFRQENRLYRFDGNGLVEVGRDPRQVFNDMWDAAFGQWGKYDPANAPDAEHPYLGNGIWMSYEEAVNVYNASVTNLRLGLPRNEAYIRQYGLRTVLPFREAKMQLNWSQTFHSCSSLEAVSSFGYIDASRAQNMFYNCQKLKKVLSYISLENCASTVDMFYHCYALEYVVFDTINCNISLADSPLWNFESVQKTIQRRASYQTKPITITVNPAVYAKLTGDTTNAAAAALTDEEAAAWQGLVTAAAAKNISFATV